MPNGASRHLNLWDDNPSIDDLLGFEAVVTPIENALAKDDLDPLTIGIHSPWGGGKTTVLGLVEKRLSPSSEDYLVIRTDPWEYDDHIDVRGTLIATVLNELEGKFKETSGVSEKIKKLTERISWGRVGTVLAKGALTMQWKPDEIVDAFTPQPKESPRSMAGFKEEFSKLINELEVRRVVILVDDLDRCLPGAVMATLEAIKLFLSVPKMTFVLAADQAMVSNAIAASLGSTGRSENFANRYLEKIVQLPISLPRLSREDAATYIALLMAAATSPNKNSYNNFLEHCRSQRERHSPPLSSLQDLSWKPEDSALQLAERIASVLSSDIVSNPRYIKRFLNAYGVRAEVAKANGIDIEPEIIAKLYLLEHQFHLEFEHLVSSSSSERAELLSSWEKWAREGVGQIPSNVREITAEWAKSEPSLADESLDKYLSLAASLTSLVAGSQLSDEQAKTVEGLSGESESLRLSSLENIKQKSTSELSSIVNALLNKGSRIESISNTIKSLVEIAKEKAELGEEIAKGIKENYWQKLTPADVVELDASEVALLTNLVDELIADEAVDETLKQAAKNLRSE